MSNEEQPLGFDIREMWSQMNVTWSESKKETYLLRPDVTKVLSVDSHVWSWVKTDVKKDMQAPTLWKDLGLWENLYHLHEYLQQDRTTVQHPYQIIGITLLRDTLAVQEQESTNSLLTVVTISLPLQ